jgi:hypothetical protein
MVSAVSSSSSPSVLATSQSQSQSQSAATTFQQVVDQYTQGMNGVGSTSANPSQTLSSGMMSSLLQMQQ